MLKISDKAALMPASPIRRLVPYSDGAKKRGLTVYHLNIGQPDIDSPVEAIDAVEKSHLKYVEYPHSAGNISYREGLVKYYENIGIDVTVNDMIVTTGGTEALQMALFVTCNPGDEVIVFEPFYTNYNAFAIELGIRFVPVTTVLDNNFALPAMSEIEKMITPSTKGILLCNPGNPTGTVYTKESLIELGKIAVKHNLYIYSDEVYREFCYTEEPHFSCMHIKGAEENVILLDSVSKRYNLCGVRIGAMVSRNKDIIAATLKKAQARLCSPAYGQIAAEGALAAPQSYFDAVREEYIKRRDLLVSELNKIPGVKCPLPMGAFYAVAELPIDDADKFAQWLLETFEYKGQTVMVTPASGFYASTHIGKREVRIAYVLKEEKLKAAVECLREALKVYPGRTV